MQGKREKTWVKVKKSKVKPDMYENKKIVIVWAEVTNMSGKGERVKNTLFTFILAV